MISGLSRSSLITPRPPDAHPPKIGVFFITINNLLFGPNNKANATTVTVLKDTDNIVNSITIEKAVTESPAVLTCIEPGR